MYAAIVFLPLLGCAIAGLFGRLIGPRPSELVTTGLLLVSAALSVVVFADVALAGGASGLALVALTGRTGASCRGRSLVLAAFVARNGPPDHFVRLWRTAPHLR